MLFSIFLKWATPNVEIVLLTHMEVGGVVDPSPVAFGEKIELTGL